MKVRQSSTLYSAPTVTLNAYSQQFSSILSSILNKHAPLKTISCRSKSRKPFITADILAEKTKRSKLEAIYRRSNEPLDKAVYKLQARVVRKFITNSRRSYFQNLISDLSSQPKKLWSALDSLLSRKTPPCLPTTNSMSDLASSFSKFFGDKIVKLCSSFPQTTPTVDSPPSPPPSPPPPLSSFFPATPEEVKIAILSSSNASCPSDVIPTGLLKACVDSLLQPITTLINLSLSEGIFPENFKHAYVSPLHKKHSLPSEDLSSYRPISNLNFISKILERIVHSRLTNHLKSFPSLSRFQSAYGPLFTSGTQKCCIQCSIFFLSNLSKSDYISIV